MSENNGGDVLAKGGTRCQFRAAGANVTKEAWDRIWAEDTDEDNDCHSDVKAAGNAGVVSRTSDSD